MSLMDYLLLCLAFFFCWIGHACVWTSILNHLYGRSLPKILLRWWRHFTALILLAFPVLLWSAKNPDAPTYSIGGDQLNGLWGRIVLVYAAICLIFGAVIFPIITVFRLLRKQPPSLLAETTRTLDLWPELGAKLIGDNRLAAMARLPWNGLFQVDFTDQTLALEDLPAQWEGLSILILSDLHFHGTPSQAFFHRIIDEIMAGPLPDLVCLIGDFIDSNEHHQWIQPILGRLKAREGKFAILGNHDLLYDPTRVRQELKSAGYEVPGNSWQEITIRDITGLVIGHEGPWFRPGPDLASAPRNTFRLCLSHTPDNFYWAQANTVSLMLCGHVHGGAIRIPGVGSIFVPSIYGRRFDMGAFEENGTSLVVSRGLSGKEPLRFRCNPQVIRLTLRKGATEVQNPPNA